MKKEEEITLKPSLSLKVTGLKVINKTLTGKKIKPIFKQMVRR